MLACFFFFFNRHHKRFERLKFVASFQGGRGQIRQKKKTVPQKVSIAKIPRAKKKYVTRVCGLATFGKNLVFYFCQLLCILSLALSFSLCFVLNINSVLTPADIELKEAQRFFAQKFSCGASVTAEDEIIIQGDFTDDIIDVIQEKWPEVSLSWALSFFFKWFLFFPQLHFLFYPHSDVKK